MSLKVWLPLNGDINNLGTSNYTINAFRGSITYNNNGKIGKCFYANGVNTLKIINIIPDFYNYTAYSLCAWACVEAQNTSHSGSAIISAGNWNNQVLNLSMSDWSTDHYTKLRISGTSWNNTYSYNFNTNTWYHIVVCCDGVKTYAYVNGTIIGATANSFIPTSIEGNDMCIGGATYYAGMQFFGKINDVRIYDHCLSAAEVREISQGLVLHYKLDSFQGGYGNPNLITNFDTSFLSYADGTTTLFTNQMNNGTQEIISNFAGARKCLHLHSNGGNGRQYRTFSVTANKTYTISADYYSTTTQATAWRGELGGGDYNWAGATAGTYDTPGNWKRMSYTYSNLTSNSTLYFFIYCSNGTDCYVKNIKIEEGSSSTIWGPSGTSVTGIQDSSGYGNNGTITGTLIIDKDTPRYNYSTYFNGSSYILTPTGSFAWNDLTQLTLCAWMKPTASMPGWSGSVGIATDTTSVARGIAITDYANEFRLTYTNGSTYVALSSGQALPQNEWHHCAMTLNNTALKLYFDGSLVKEETINWGTATLNTNARFEVGVDIPGTDEKFTGNYSDVRCYCTALDADAIRQLYEVGAKVDNKNNVHSFELNENEKNEITKTGQLKCSAFTEFAGMSYLKYDPNLYIEPDGSCWVRVYHHNNPGAGSFSSTNDFEHSVYIDENRWFNVEVANYLDKWEIMMKGKFTATSDEWKLRWIQQYNPMTATYANVAAANVTKITTDGYSDYASNWGGLYAKKGSAYLTTNNGNSGNWWGAVGSYSIYQSGIPGWGPSGTVTTTGYNDMYLRIDNVTFTSPIAKSTKNNIWTGNEIIEL